MPSFRNRFCNWAIPLLLVALVAQAGCGGGDPQIVELSGTLTYKGKAVPNALLNFLPENGRQSWATTDERGRFTVNYDRHQDGLVVGKHRIWAEFRANSPEQQDAILMGNAPPLSKEMSEFFNKYSYKNSKLEVQIDKDTGGELKLELD